MDEMLIRSIVNQIIRECENNIQDNRIPIEASARHVHLTGADVDTLFGSGYKLTPKKSLSQPGQYLCEERVKIVSKTGQFQNVAILGPVRESTQVEISASDARALGLDVPVKMSGDLSGAGSIAIVSEIAAVWAESSVIIAKAHIHMTPQDAGKFGVRDNQSVKVTVSTQRPVTFDDVVVRVSDRYSLAMHIDFDEANACAASGNVTGCIIG